MPSPLIVKTGLTVCFPLADEARRDAGLFFCGIIVIPKS
jgi:hypothetical protein